MNEFNWNDYLLLAEYLNGATITDEIAGAKLRTAISRTYYSVFNITKSHLNKYCQITRNYPEFKKWRDKYGSHGIIHNLLTVSENEDVSLAGQKLFTLKKKRVDADYKSRFSRLRANPIARDVNDCLIYAAKILGTLKLISDRKVEIKLEHLNRLSRN